jgi:hypothetical protein
MPTGTFTTPRPVPGRLAPALAAAMVIALALPVFAVAGWRLSGWALGAVLWCATEAFVLLVARLRSGMSNLAGSGVLAFGMMFRAVAVMVVVFAVAAADARLALAGALVYGLAYTAELGLSLLSYFEDRAS